MAKKVAPAKPAAKAKPAARPAAKAKAGMIGKVPPKKPTGRTVIG
jgi:hypothetical protein